MFNKKENDNEVKLSDFSNGLSGVSEETLKALMEKLIQKIHPQKAKSNLEEEKIYNLNDMDYSNLNKKINNYKDSNINITFFENP